jgi:hypothetical protein
MTAPPDADALYDLEPSAFTAARNALAKQLRADGRREDAAAVAGLRRPSLVAWALNQVARRRPDEVAAAVDSAATVATAQQELLAGGAASGLREAIAAHRRATAAVVGAAAERAGEGHRDALTATLDAALADPGLTERLRAGTLAETLEAPAGFGFGLGTEPPTSVPRRSRRGGPAPARPAAGADAPDEDAAAADARARAEERRRLERLEQEIVAAGQAVAGCERDLQAAEEEVAAAEAEVARARTRLGAAHEARGEADDALAIARAERDRLASERVR